MSSFPSFPRSNKLIIIYYQTERQKTEIKHQEEVKEEVIPEVIYLLYTNQYSFSI